MSPVGEIAESTPQIDASCRTSVSQHNHKDDVHQDSRCFSETSGADATFDQHMNGRL